MEGYSLSCLPHLKRSLVFRRQFNDCLFIPLGEGHKGTVTDRGDSMERKHNTALTQNAKTLRKNMTKEERRLWYNFLRTYPVRFLRQKVIDEYVVDFYCHDAKLVVEIDGSQHFTLEGKPKDTIRTAELNARNLTVIRIANSAIHSDFSGVCEYIDYWVKKRME